jgi:DNA gyrase subunit A
VFPGDEAILISDKGTLVRIPTDQVSTQGRNTQGVRLINLTRDEHLVGMAAVDEPEGAEFEDDDEDEGSE